MPETGKEQERRTSRGRPSEPAESNASNEEANGGRFTVRSGGERSLSSAATAAAAAAAIAFISPIDVALGLRRSLCDADTKACSAASSAARMLSRCVVAASMALA